MTNLAHAQNTGTLSGTVRDTTGAIIPGAQITVVNADSKARRVTVSNGEGFFSVVALQTATYNVNVTAKGFSSLHITGVEIHPGDSVTLDKLAMEIGAVDVQVTVTAYNAGVSLTSPEKSSLITAEDIKRLSTVGRDATELIKMLPGFAVASGGSGAAGQIGNSPTSLGEQTMGFGSSSVSSFSANGSTPQTGATTVIQDGASVMDPGDMGASISNVNMDTVAEIKVQTSNFGADSAKGPVVINAVGKSGGANYHGSAYVFARNYALNSNEWLNNYYGITRPESGYYYPGANIGGPVRIPGTNFNRNKRLTFFTSFEVYKQTSFLQTIQSFVPTARMLGGDLTAASIGAALNVDASVVQAQCPNFYSSGTLTNSGGFCYVPGTNGTTYTQQDCQIVNGVIAGTATSPAGCVSGDPLPVDPRALIYAKFWPAANRQPRAANGLASDGYNYVKAVTATHNGYQFRGRLDQNFSDNTKLYGTYNLESINDQSPITDAFYAGSDLIPYPTPAYSHARSSSVSLNFTHVFNPTLTNEFVPAGTYYYQPAQLANRALVNDTTTGWTGGRFYDNGSTQLPNIIDYEEGVPDFAMSYFAPNSKYFRKFSYDFADNVTKQYRTHSIKVGFYFEQTANNQVGYPVSQGQYAFNHYNQGCNTNDGLNISVLQNNIANFLQGCAGFTQQSDANPVDMYFHTIDFYATDEWKATKKLTVTYGVRFDHLGPWYDAHGVGLAVWNPPAKFVNNTGVTQDPHTYPGISWHQTNPAVPISGSPTTFLFYAPRAGIAYDLFGDGKSVLRGGWGAYRFHDSYNDAAGPLATSLGRQNFTAPPNIGCTFDQITKAGYYTPAANRGGPCANANASSGPITIYALDPTDKEQPVTYNYNFTLDQSLPGSSNLEVSYVGNQSHHTFTAGNLTNQNVIQLGGLFQPDPITGAIAQSGSTGQVQQDYRPYPYYASVYVPHHIGYGNYNALQVTWNKQKGAFIFNVNYTWSKALGIRGDYRSGYIGDPTVLRNNYGLLGFNRHNAVNFTYSYQVGNAYHGNRIVAGILNQWEITGITNIQSGPDTAVLGANTNYGLGGGVSYTPAGATSPVQLNISNSTLLGTPDINLQPVVTCNPKSGLIKGDARGRQYINGACFALPKLGSNGTFNLPDIHGPSYFSSDLTLQRTVKLHERKELQFRLAGFNFLNHPLPQFGNGNGGSGLSLGFGSPATSMATTPQDAIAGAVQDSLTFGFTPYRTGYRVVELGARFNF
jgi:hypothetical protein